MDLLTSIGQALLMAFGMFWKTGWSLVLGFLISAVLQAVVSKDRMRSALGRAGPKEIALATALGAASSSCSYAAAAISRTLFKKGAALIPSLAFQFASTNLVVELGLILLILMGWQFMAAEWIGGVVLIVIMALLVRLTYPAKLVEEARQHPEAGGGGHQHEEAAGDGGGSLWQKLRAPATRAAIARNFAMDWRMLWKDLALGFLIAGALSAFVPDHIWHRLFLLDAPAWLQVPVNAVIGPLVAVITFVCSIGNVPMAAVLWGSGVQLRRRLGVPLRRFDRAAAARRVPALLRMEDGRVHRRHFLHNHGAGRDCHGRRFHQPWPRSGPRSQHQSRNEQLRNRLHLLAQHRVRRAGGLAIPDRRSHSVRRGLHRCEHHAAKASANGGHGGHSCH